MFTGIGVVTIGLLGFWIAGEVGEVLASGVESYDEYIDRVGGAE